MAIRAITVDDSDGTNVTYTEVPAQQLGSIELRNFADPAAALRGIVFTNTFGKTPGTSVDRRRLHIFKTTEDSETGILHRGSITCEMVIPPTEDFQALQMKNLVSHLIAILARDSAGVVDYVNVGTLFGGGLPDGDFAT